MYIIPESFSQRLRSPKVSSPARPGPGRSRCMLWARLLRQERPSVIQQRNPSHHPALTHPSSNTVPARVGCDIIVMLTLPSSKHNVHLSYCTGARGHASLTPGSITISISSSLLVRTLWPRAIHRAFYQPAILTTAWWSSVRAQFPHP